MAEQDPQDPNPGDYGDYSELADEHLDELEAGPDADLYNRVIDACDVVLNHPAEARRHSSTIVTGDGHTLLVLPVAGGGKRIYWSSGPPPRIEAVI